MIKRVGRDGCGERWYELGAFNSIIINNYVVFYRVATRDFFSEVFSSFFLTVRSLRFFCYMCYNSFVFVFVFVCSLYFMWLNFIFLKWKIKLLVFFFFGEISFIFFINYKYVLVVNRVLVILEVNFFLFSVRFEVVEGDSVIWI